MGFFDALRQILQAERDDRGDRGDPRLAETGGLDDSAHPEYPAGAAAAADPDEMAAPPRTADYDREHWRRKLKRILEQLPASREAWPALMTDAGALDLDTAWVESCQREEFALMVRKVVSDRVVTLEEHSKLELARALIGLPDAEAEAVLRGIVADAESFFGRPVEGARPAGAGA